MVVSSQDGDERKSAAWRARVLANGTFAKAIRPMSSDLLDWTFRGNRSGRKVKIPGYRLDKHGKLVKDPKRLNVVQRIQQRNSTRIRYKKGTP